MSPKQRFYAALELRPADRPPVFYQHLGAAKWILEYTGLKMYDGFHDPDVFARLAMGAYHLYGYDTVMAGWGDLLIEAQAHGLPAVVYDVRGISECFLPGDTGYVLPPGDQTGFRLAIQRLAGAAENRY